MMVGAPISTKLRSAGLTAATDEYEQWQDPQQRKKELENFKSNLAHYVPGKPVKQDTKGLFARLAEIFKGD